MICKRLPKARWVPHDYSVGGASEQQPDKVRILLLVTALQACGLLRDLDTGRRIHRDSTASVAAAAAAANKYVANTLLSMYAKCHSLDEARAVFDRMLFRTASSWTSLILGYVEIGDGDLALKLFESLLAEGAAAPRLDARVFVAGLKACAGLAEKEPSQPVDGLFVKPRSLSSGLSVHSRAAELGFVSDRFVANTLIDMYCKCCSLETARAVFRGMACPDVVSWTALVLGHAENGEEEAALDLFFEMQASGIDPDALSFAAALRACLGLLQTRIHPGALRDRVEELHRQARVSGCDVHARVASLLIDLYSKLGSVADARRVYETVRSERDPVLWTMMILGYAENREPDLALELFYQMVAIMKNSSCAPNQLTYVAALKACSSLASMAKPGIQQQQLGYDPERIKSLESGMFVHSHAADAGLASDTFIANSLIDMYFKCGSPVDASIVFFRKMPARTVVSWNTAILGFAENHEELLALDLFRVMESQGCCKPDALTYVAALRACCNLAENEPAAAGPDRKSVALNRGVDLHSRASASGHDTNKLVASSLVSMYSKCGSLGEALIVFERIPSRDVDAVSLTSLILACAENRQPELALKLLARMQSPDALAFAAALKACGDLAVVETVREIHARVLRAGFETDLFLVNCLIEVYGSSGGVIIARIVFDSLAATSIVTWHSLIAGYSRSGDVKRLLDLFDSFRDEGFRANAVTFVYLLSACSHAGDVDRGLEFFRVMKSGYGIEPRMEHYLCVVDLLGRSNRLDAAVDVVETMPFEADALTWMTILGACYKWKNVTIGKRAFDNLMKLDEDRDSVYSLMSNIYGSVGLWEEQSKVEATRKKRLEINMSCLC